MKKLISMLLCLAMLLGMLPAAYLAVSAEVTQTPITIAASNPGTNYEWFNHNGFVNNDTKILEIADEGADDVGSVHVYQPDGQTADADMMIGIRMDCVPTGTYTIQYKIKGTDLGNADNNSNRFYLYGNETLTNQFRVAAGAKTLSDWTTVTETFTTTCDVYYIYLMVSKYVNGADYYVDNVKLLDASGNDMLCGAGNFCTTAEGGTEEETGGLITLDTADISGAYDLTEKKWTVMYPAGAPDTGTWSAWDSSTHYGEIVASGNQDAGALHLKSWSDGTTGINTGVAFGAGMTAGESYTLGLWAKGTSNSGRVLALYANGDPAIIGASSELSAGWSYYEITLTATVGQLNILASDWGVTDIYIDNITLIGSDGVDLLSGYGDFCTDTASETPQLSQIYDSDPGEKYQWYNGNGYTVSDSMYIEIVEEGADDAGAVHIYQTDGVVAAEDMRLHLKTDGIGVGTYTLQYNIKGSDLGISTTNDACRFYLNNDSDITTQFRNLAGAKTISDWTALSETITTTTESSHIILGISKYVSGIDCYVDNVKLLDAEGNDLLNGAGNFCIVVSTDEPEEDVSGTSIYGKSALFTGDSISWGNDRRAWAARIGEKYDMDYVNASVSGASVSTARDYRMIDQIEAHKTESYDYVIMHGPTNDAWDLVTVGELTDSLDVADYNVDTYAGALEELFYYARKYFPDARLGYIINFRFSSSLNNGLSDMSAYVEMAKMVCGKWSVPYLDLYNNEELTVALKVGTQVYLPDDIHPNAAGYDIITPYIETWMLDVVANEEPEIGETIPVSIYDADPQELYLWYNSNGYTDTDDMYIEIVSEGADDVGALHVYQTDGVTGTEDMKLKMHTGYIQAGTYTLKMKIKGTDLGNTDTANACRFYVSSNDSVFPQIRNLAGSKSVAEWTEFSQTVDTDVGAFVFSLSISKYVNGADFYIDNLQLLDVDGNDMLQGAGSFCTVYTGSEEENTEGLLTLDAEAMANAYQAPNGVWTPMYPSGTPTSGSTWLAWDDTHYAEIVAAGYRDRGALHMKSASYKNTAVAIGVDMVVGETYTLGLWAKGISNSGKVLAQYGNGDPVVIAASTALTSDWSYYECVFTAGLTQLNLLAPDWGVTNIYIDHITLIGEDGVDLLEGYGDFCTEQYRVEDPLYLVNFDDTEESELAAVIGQAAVDGASDPTLTLNTEEGENGNALQATWSYDGTNPSYLHRYTATQDSWAGTFAQEAGNYRYLRMWINNPSHVSVDVTILLSGEDTVNYFNASAIKLIRKDGTQVYGSTNNNSGYGENSCISIPKQFVGWLSIPLNTDNLLAADGYTAVISEFANVTGLEMEFRKLATTGEGDSSEYYYVIDDICLSFDITGKKQSTEDGSDYANYDTSVKGSGQVKNIIFLIGDGMGYGSLDVARLDRPTLYMDTIEEKGGVIGEVATTNLYGAVTDSAAAGTALATGFLTKNTVLGLTENLEPVMNLGEYMKQLNKKLGLVTTTYVLDATPAAFAVHTSARGNYTSIALDMLSLGVDVVQGGGRSYLMASVMDSEGKAQTLTELAQSQYGYTYATTTAEMDAVTSGKLWGIYEEYNMPWVKYETATDSTPTLAEMTAKTFQLLESEDGFFAMIEGGQIDVAGHNNSAIDTRLETLAFDDAVKVAMDYVDNNPGTLMIITADHETGGVRVAEDGTVSYYTTSHTDELVPYYAYGTGAEYFADLTVNTEINYAIRQATIGDVSVGATSVATEAQLTDTEVMTVTAQDGIITYTGVEQLAEIALSDADAAYAVVKYKTDERNLVGAMDEAKIQYAGDGLWHISDILVLSDSDTHIFQPMSYIKGDIYNSIDIAGKSVQIDYVGLFETYEQAAAFQAHAALTGATPTALNSLSMSLGDDLDMHFYVAADETNLENTTVSLLVGEESYSFSPTEPDAQTGDYKFSVELAAAQMTDTVTFQLKIGEDIIETGTYTVRQYADAVLAGSYDEATKTLVREMLNYGGAAQSYFGYNTADLANDGITGAGEQEIPSQAQQEVTVQDQVTDVAFYGASMVFRSRIAVRFYFNGDVTGCSFTANGQTLTPVQKDGVCYVEIADILPQALDEQITLTVTDANGSRLTVSYSPMNYIVRMNAKGGDALKAVLKAMYNYCLAAESVVKV